VAGIPSIVVVQAPNVPIIISNNPASNIPIILPPIVSLPGQKKKLRSKNKETKKTRSKNNKARNKEQKKEKKKQEKRLKKNKEKMSSN
jgi:hypothetical protein